MAALPFKKAEGGLLSRHFVAFKSFNGNSFKPMKNLPT